MPASARRHRLHRLLLRGHDALERRVARLVDLLDHADHRGQRGFDLEVPVLGDPADADRRAVDLDLAGQRDLRHAEPFGQHRGHHAHPGVGGFRAADHQVEAGSGEDLGDGVGGGQGVRPGQPVVQQVHGLVRAHGQGLADGLGGLLRAHGQDRDLGVGARRALGLGDLQALLDGVLVELVDEPVHRRAVQRAVRVRELTFGPGIWHLLDQHDDVHGLHRPPCSLAYSLPNRAVTAGHRVHGHHVTSQ